MAAFELQPTKASPVLFPMPTDLRPIIEETASEADDFLAGATSREQGRAGIAEFLTVEFNFLAAVERKTVIDAVMSILEEEDFFGTEFVGNPFTDETEED